MSFHSSPSRRRSFLLIAVTLWVYRRLLYLHPPAFRRDFGGPIIQVFAQTCRDAQRAAGAGGVARLWLPALGDLLRGAFAEYVSLIMQKGSYVMPQYRRSASIIFAAYIAFVVAGISFNKMSEDVMKSTLPSNYPILAIAYDAVAVGSVVSLLAVLAGGLPIAWEALRFAFANGRRDILARFAVPPLALAVIVGYFLLVVFLHIGGTAATTIHAPARIFGVGALVVIFLAGAVASTIAVLDAIARSDIAERFFRFSLLAGVLATVAMLCMLLATAAWSIGLWQDAPAHFFGNDGFLATSTLFYICVQLVLMVAATGIAIWAVSRGLTTRNANTPHLA